MFKVLQCVGPGAWYLSACDSGFMSSWRKIVKIGMMNSIQIIILLTDLVAGSYHPPPIITTNNNIPCHEHTGHLP